jgi:hypothetical protein
VTSFPTLEPQFHNGDALLCEGIAFFIDLNDSETLYAASPSSLATKERMDLIVNEALRILPVFLVEHRSTRDALKQRRLVVRMITTYSDLRTDRFAPVDLGRRPIEQATLNHIASMENWIG